MRKHIAKDLTSISNYALMRPKLLIPSHNKSDIRMVLTIQQVLHIKSQSLRRYLYTNLQDPQVIKTYLTVIAPKNKKLPLQNIGGMPASWLWLILKKLLFLLVRIILGVFVDLDVYVLPSVVFSV